MKTVCFADLHGNYNLWTAIKNYYGPKDTLIFLGDACDRGPDGIKIMKEMFKDSRVIYILGNHEQMLLEYIQDGIEQSLITSMELITYNGSLKTLRDYQNLNPIEQNKLIQNLKEKTKNYYIYINKEKKNFFLSHAGIDINTINEIDNKKLLWDREHIKSNKIWDNKYKYWYIVHGHTPVQIIQPNKVIPEIYRYYNNHKIDIDMGTPSSKKIAVLGLDTLQVKYFKENKNE